MYYVYACVSISLCVCMYVCRLTSHVFFTQCPAYTLRQDLSVNLEFAVVASLVSQLASGISCLMEAGMREGHQAHLAFIWILSMATL